MPAKQASHPASAASQTHPHAATTRVWDGFVRFFHWSLVITFALSYWSTKAGHNQLHALLGYFLAGLIVCRIFWGFYGPRHARFSDFLCSPITVLHYLKTIVAGHPRRHLGHNPAGGLMVVALLGVLLFISLTGLLTLAVIDFDGPLLALTHAINDHQAYAIREAHDVAVNLILVMLGLHLLGVLLASFQHRENLVRAMITGDKEIDGEPEAEPVASPQEPAAQIPAYSIVAKRH